MAIKTKISILTLILRFLRKIRVVNAQKVDASRTIANATNVDSIVLISVVVVIVETPFESDYLNAFINLLDFFLLILKKPVGFF